MQALPIVSANPAAALEMSRPTKGKENFGPTDKGSKAATANAMRAFVGTAHSRRHGSHFAAD